MREAAGCVMFMAAAAALTMFFDHHEHAQMAHLQPGAQQGVVFEDKKPFSILRMLILFMVVHRLFVSLIRLLYRFNISKLI